MAIRSTLATRLTALALAALATACSTVRFENVQTTEQGFDSRLGAYAVRVRFEVLQGELPVQGLRAHDFTIVEDGVEATTESIQSVDLDELRLPVTLLLDTSYSMYTSDAVGPLKQAARGFVQELERSGFTVEVLAFDSDVRPVTDVAEIPETWDKREASARWTSLYHAIGVALEHNRDGILVVFSDGADNYSQNHGVEGIDQLAELIGQRQIHVVGFGGVKNEFDRQGNDARRVLQRISNSGTYQYAAGEADLSEVFGYIARRLRNIYSIEYYSPNHAGEHEIVIRYGWARTKPIPFRASTVDTARPASGRPD